MLGRPPTDFAGYRGLADATAFSVTDVDEAAEAMRQLIVLIDEA